MISESKQNHLKQSDTPKGVVMRTGGHKPVKYFTRGKGVYIMLNLNKVIITGHLTETPEIRSTGKNQMTAFSIGVSTGKEASIFVKIVAFGDKAEVATKYFAKGTPICVIGSINARDYTTKDGKKARDFYILADELKFILNKSKDESDHTVDDLPY